MKKRFLSLLMGAIMVMTAISPAFTCGTGVRDVDVATTTTYDYQWWALATVRNKLTTTHKSTSTSYSPYITVDTFTNEKYYPVEHEFSDSSTKSSSVSLGTKVTIDAIETEFGADASYSNTKTYNTTVNVPGYDTATLKVRTMTETLKYSTVVQRQDLYLDLVWRNNGSSFTASSTQIAKSPNWVLQ